MNYNLHHVSLVIANVDRALAFYQGILGFDLAQRPDMAFNGVWLVAGLAQIHLLELPNPDPVVDRPQHGGRDRHVAFHVQDLSEIKAVLAQASIAFTLSSSGRQALFCRDPDANGLEFIQSL